MSLVKKARLDIRDNYRQISEEPGIDERALSRLIYAEKNLSQLFMSLRGEGLCEGLSFRRFLKRVNTLYRMILILPELYALDIASRAHAKVLEYPTPASSMRKRIDFAKLVEIVRMHYGSCKGLDLNRFLSTNVCPDLALYYHYPTEQNANSLLSLRKTTARVICEIIEFDTYVEREQMEVAYDMFDKYFKMSEYLGIFGIATSEISAKNGHIYQAMCDSAFEFKDTGIIEPRFSLIYNFPRMVSGLLSRDRKSKPELELRASYSLLLSHCLSRECSRLEDVEIVFNQIILAFERLAQVEATDNDEGFMEIPRCLHQPLLENSKVLISAVTMYVLSE